MTIIVRRATPNDAAAYARIMGDPAVYPGLMQLPILGTLFRSRDYTNHQSELMVRASVTTVKCGQKTWPSRRSRLSSHE